MPERQIRFRLILVAVALLLLGGACDRPGRVPFPDAVLTRLHSNSAKTPDTATTAASADADAVALIALSDLAMKRAQTVAPDAVLRQIDVDWTSPWIGFRFTDAAATQEIDITMANPRQPPDEWQLDTPSLSKLAGWTQPSLDVHALRVGPAAVAAAMLGFAPGSRVRSMTLAGPPTVTSLTWYVFSELSGGLLLGTVSNDTGVIRCEGPCVPAPTPVTLPAP